MEAQQHQELEMAEVTSKVYDIIHPTPVSLKQLSAIVVSLEIWRHKINEYRTSKKLKEFDPRWLENTWMKTMLPDLPSTIYKTIEEVSTRFRHSIEYWRTHHYDMGFCYQYSHENYVLEDFDDFVCDYDGSIDYARTAQCMMRCEGFNSEMKFIIACMYFFEDDIRIIWPSVSRNMNVDLIDFDKCPQSYYWICRLTNKLDKIPTMSRETVDERMLMAWMPYNRPSVEYFWNRIPHENQLQRDVDELLNYNFVRFILPKLDDRQLVEFFDDSNGNRLYTVFVNLYCDEWVVLRTWFHIWNIVRESDFTNCIIRMFGLECGIDDERFDMKKWQYLSLHVWNHAPLNLKQSVIRVISSDSSWFEAISLDCAIDPFYDYNQINVELPLTILQDASLEERNLFWRNSWSFLIEVVRSKDLPGVMELCFENEDEMNQFKQNVMVRSGEVLEFCVTLLESGYLRELKAFMNFCCPELQATRNFKQRILYSAFHDEPCHPNNLSSIVCAIEEFNDFVEDVSTNFKDWLISSPSFMESLSGVICYAECASETIIKFIEFALVSMDNTVMQVKMSLIDSLKQYLTKNARYCDDTFDKNVFNSILLWCLGSNERVEEFKLSMHFVVEPDGHQKSSQRICDFYSSI
ncbi:uncharacterized protein LOC135847732 isoform X2 [Planococcus citri]|uniref:uncharacterized protein LOC135847732 isoform X2 n=1 Tax=Planococcus citri TaxID=170843 RepID=UPI0031F8E580